ncbi:hypothetical protein EC973_002616 [Apophysomyces ossiformis]|uniref:Uncharacterized protein n=1 Tax=Apophysomyces ossiformis TaxID=679940 RepID=A0A8H7BNJ7_9FUNG|nr:hypothetical protein EC973_002616 [Apophysomyces ossiformis]
MLCTGDFFAENTNEDDIKDLIDGKIEVPLTTYFMVGSNPLPDSVQSHIKSTDGELCSNLHFLGKQGVLTTAEGLTVAFVSGVYDETGSKPNGYQSSDMAKLKSTRFPITSPPGVDILLSHEWPQAIEVGSAITPANSLSTVAKPIAELAAALKPRYHFAASEAVFYEREPYLNMTGFGSNDDEQAAEHVSRFIGLGDVLNGEKHRWFYAFRLEPLSKVSLDSLQAKPRNVTECPFQGLLIGSGQKRPHPGDSDVGSYFWGTEHREAKRSAVSQATHSLPENYVCRICNTPGHHIKDCPQGGNRRERGTRAPPPGYVAKHLIVSIGTLVYATLARGPVVSSSDSKVPGGGHILLIPIPHYPTFRKIPMESQIEVIAEMEKYKSALRHMYASYGQDMVVFEVSRESLHGMSHAHIQVVPIPKDKADLIETVAREEAERHGMTFIDRVPDSPEVAYFKLELPNGKSLVHIIQPRERFNLQFGRLLVTKVLGQPEREDWKACAQSEDEERKDAKAFVAAFKPFDFSL